jgi:DNA invertase Pin-like site-specific DNA recombinase
VKLVCETVPQEENNMLIGYARVSTDDQRTENQIEQLVKAGCDPKHIYKETASGGVWERPRLHKALEHLRDGDVLMVWKLDRLSRSLSDLLRILERIDKTGASFKSLTETIDTSGPCGRLMMNMLGAFNQFEREIIKERTKLGLKRARANGRIGGGRFILSKTQQAAALRMVDSGEKTQTEVAELFDVSKATLSRLIARAHAKRLRDL